MRILKRLLRSALISVVIFFAIAFGLVVSQGLEELSGEGGLNFTGQVSTGITNTTPLTAYTARDGTSLATRTYSSTALNPPLVVLVHGSGWHGLQFDGLARELAEYADVVVPDLRGHGVSPVRRGDVDYIGQLEDDLADLINLMRKPGQAVVLAGHSSGGGLVVRFAGGMHRDLISGAVLMAPFLQYDAPTTRPNSGGWAQPLTRRIIGLTMLNAVNIRFLNHLPAIQFNFPTGVLDGPLGASATPNYSFRLNTSFAPRRDYLTDAAALPPFLLIAGSEDEAFVAEEYEPLMSSASNEGQYLLVDGVGHLDVVNAPETRGAIAAFLKQFAGS